MGPGPFFRFDAELISCGPHSDWQRRQEWNAFLSGFSKVASVVYCGPDRISEDHKSKFAIDPRLLPLVGFIDLNRLLNPMVAKFLGPIMA